MATGRNDLWTEVQSHRVAPPALATYSATLPDFDADDGESYGEDGDTPTWEAQSITGRTYILHYADSKGQSSVRQVLCRRIEQRAALSYLHAFCYARERVRAFRGDRIAAIIDPVTGEIHEPGATLLQQFLPDSTTQTPWRYGLTPKQFGDFNAALNVLSFIARCDGQWHDEEAARIEDFAAAYWLRSEIEAPLDAEEVIRHAKRLAPDGEAFWVSLLRCAKHPILARTIPRHIAAVIAADGILHEKELYWGSKVDEFFRS